MAERKLSFKEVVNVAIAWTCSDGTPAGQSANAPHGPPLVNLDKASQLAGDLEDEEIIRKMSMGK